MTLAPWRSPLSAALHRNRSLAYARYVQLATVRPNGRPANRTIVFRGFLEATNTLKFVTDRRSEKINQIAVQRWGEICWYFPKTREQFRFLGELTVVQESCTDSNLFKARTQQWQDLSDAARSQFAWAHPKQPRAKSEAFDSPPPDPETPLSDFCLLLFEPIEVDHLELRGNPQNRYLYQRETDPYTWTTAEVNP
jgi:PPOX class probable FMN-dependent enzyme